MPLRRRHGLALACLLLIGVLARLAQADARADAAALLAGGGAGPDRSAGTAAALQNADYIEGQLRQLPAAAGAKIFRQSFLMTLPVVDVCRMMPVEPAGAPALAVAPLEPMGGLPPQLGTRDAPRELAVVYGGQGRWEDLKGQVIAGRLVALEIDAAEGSECWRRCAELGAAGIVFLGDGNTPAGAFLNKCTTVPLGLPRFYCDDPAAVVWFRGAREGSRVAAELVTHWQEKRVDNVVCVLPAGTSGAGDWASQWAVLQARYDGVSPVMTRAPSATTAANAAMLLDLARQMAYAPARRTTVLVWTGGDAWNFRGTREFLDMVYPGDPAHAVARQRDRLTLVESRLRAAQIARDEAQANAASFDPAGIGHIDLLLDEELLRQSSLAEQHLEHARTADPTGDSADSRRWKTRKLDLLLADNAATGHAVSAPTPAQRVLLQDAAEQVRQRWAVEAERLTGQAAALRNWPDLRAAIPAKDPVFFLSLAFTAGSDLLPPLNFGLLSRSNYCAGLDVAGPMSSFGQAFRRYAVDTPRFAADSMDNSVALPALLPIRLGFSSDAAIARGIPAAAAATLLDPYTAQDSPNDTPAHFLWPAAEAQVQSLTRLLLGPPARPGMLTDPQFYGRANLSRQTADQLLTVFEHAVGENLPRLKAAGALVGGESEIRHPLGDPLAGTRRTDWYLSHADGTVEFTSLLRAQEAELRLQAFQFDAAGQPVRAVAANQSETRGMVASIFPTDTPRRAMLFDCRPFDAYGLFDPRYLDYLEQIQLLDARRLDAAQFSVVYARDGVAACFLPPQDDIRWQLLASRGNVSNRMIVLNADAEHPAGTGFASTDPAQIGPLPWRAAQDFNHLDQQRKADLEKFGISNEVIRQLQSESQTQLAAARTAETAHDYPAFAAATDALWSLQAQEYQNLKDTSNGIIEGVIFLLLGVIPFSYFLERLLVGSSNVYRQIMWFGIIFLCMVGGLWFHPAFRISTAPIMILLAFFILILSSTVVYILWGKFEEEIRRLRGSSGESQHIQSFRRGAVIGAAIRLGLSNMRRRGLRTALTLVTLVLLTFTLLCFTSVRESVQVSPQPVAYFATRGTPMPPPAILLRQRGWEELPVQALELARGMALARPPLATQDSSLKTQAASLPPVAGRWWYASQRSEQTWQLPVQPAAASTAGKSSSVAGLIGLDVAEAQFEPLSPLSKLADDECRLPAKCRQIIGVNTGDTVVILGYRLKVAGFFTSDEFAQFRQLTGDTFAPLDPSGEKNAGAGAANQPYRPETTYRFLDPVSVAIVPARLTEQLGGRLTSVILRPSVIGGDSSPIAIENQKSKIENDAEALARRCAFTLYASTGARVLSINAAEASRPQDLSAVLVPMIIAGIIVLNTMLGAVAERSREIHVYTSVGLSPTHVGMLFLAEAAALGTLGVVFGYIFGQGLATILSWTHLMPGVDLNYSSMSAIITMGLVLGIVMLSALWPAYSASRLATPSLQRDWKLPRPVGDVMDVDLPFTVNDAAAKGVLAFLAEFLTTTTTAGTGRFTADAPAGAATAGTQGLTRSLTARLWLAPYDLGVIQSVAISIHPTDQPGVFDVHVKLTREAGNPGTWRRLNRPFLMEIRKQFLLWRTLDAQRVANYVRQSDTLFGSGNTKGQ